MTQEGFNVLWLQAGSCGGCAAASLCAESPNLHATFETFNMNLLWHPALSQENGAEVVAVLDAIHEGRTPLDLLVVEGAVLRGPGGSGRFHMVPGTGQSMAALLKDLSARARYVLAVGSCASFGGMAAASPNRTEACGVQYDGESPGGLLGAKYRSGAGLPVINLPGCAPHPDWIAETMVTLSMGKVGADDLDPLNRPWAFFDRLAHHGCSRNEFYEFKASAEKPSDLGCLMENLGCKATQAHGDCNIRTWNGTGSCTNGGYACIGCTSPGFEEPGSPFSRTPKVAGIPVGLPVDMPKAWFVALAALSKSATPERVKKNATQDHPIIAPVIRSLGKGRRK